MGDLIMRPLSRFVRDAQASEPAWLTELWNSVMGVLATVSDSSLVESVKHFAERTLPEGAVHFLLVALLVAVLHLFFGAAPERWLQSLFGRYARRIRGLFRKTHTFDHYFHALTRDPMDYIVYPFGLRPTLAWADVLYLEFLHRLILDGRTSRVLIFPSIDGTYPKQDTAQLTELESNVRRVFGHCGEKVTVVDLGNVTVTAEHFLSPGFIEAMEAISSSEFLEFVNRNLHLQVRGLFEFNAHHPSAHRLRSLYVHLVNGMIIEEYLRRNGIVGLVPVALGVMFWETEITKLGMFYSMKNKAHNLTLVTIMGRTILARNGRPMPVFEPGKTLFVFANLADIVSKLDLAQRRENEKYAEVLEAILAQNYETTIDSRDVVRRGRELLAVANFNSRGAREVILTPSACKTLGLLGALREKYGYRLT